MMGLQRYGLVLAGLVIFALVLMAPVSAAVVTIDNTQSIQTAVNTLAASPDLSDTLILNPGTYSENGITISKNITIQANTSFGHSATDTIIDGMSTSPRIFTVNAVVSLAIDNLTLQNGRGTNSDSVTDNGGAIGIYGGTLTITSSTFADCSAGMYGGAIYSNSGSTVSIAESTFLNCQADNDGGAIMNNGGILDITTTSFTTCSAANGGAIRSDGTLSVTASTFSGCTATNLGGAIRSSGTATISGSSTFTSCTAPYGGAIQVASGTLAITGATFSNCSATDDGGAINNAYGTVSINDSTFTSCSATYGGAIYNPGTGTITGSTFISCAATYGGAIFNGEMIVIADTGTLTITSSTFSDCSATNGGAIYSDSTITISSSTFSGCTATNFGGAIMNRLGVATITTTTISGCSAAYGGGIYSLASHPLLTITSSSISDCSATQRGGAIFHNEGQLEMNFSRIYHCNGNNKKAVEMYNGNINVRNNWWGDNSNPSGSVNGIVDDYYTPWLILGITANPAAISTSGTSAIRTNLTYNSTPGDTSGFGLFVPDGIPAAFSITSGTGSILPAAGNLSAGANTTLFSPDYSGTRIISATVDDETVSIEVTVTRAPAPAVSSIIPNSGINTSAVSITNMVGSGFWTHGTTTINLTRVGYANITATGVTVVNPAQITCTFPITGAEAGTWNVVVINPDGQEGMLSSGFTITAPAPTVTAITPNTGINTSSVTITNLVGTNFASGVTVNLTRTDYENITATGVNVPLTTQITCTFPITGAEAGTWNVVVINPDGQEGVLSSGFTITALTPAPEINDITPSTGLNTSSVSITNLSGRFFQTTGTTTVNLTRAGYANITATGVHVESSVNITCTFPITHQPAGTWNVVVTNPDEQEGMLPDGFTITAPAPTTRPTTLPTTIPTPIRTPDRINGGDDAPVTTTVAVTPTQAPPGSLEVNVGGNSAVNRVVVTGTGIAGLIVTGTVQPVPGTNLTAPPGTIFQYISLVPARFTTITGAVIHFSIPQSWLDEHHIAPGSIILYHHTGNGWEALPTTLLYTKDGSVFFSAQSGSFSLFAIAGTPGSAVPVTVSVPPEVLSSAVQEQAPVPAAAIQTPVTTQTTAPPATTTQPAAPSPLLNVMLVIAAIGVLAVGGFLARRWWIHRQNPALFKDYD